MIFLPFGDLYGLPGGMDRAALDSQAVVSAGYEPQSQTLELEFSTGRIYQYDGVPASVYQWLLRTKSKGSYVSRMINGRYGYRDVSPSQRRAEHTSDADLEAVLRASLRDREP
ncbi:MAG: KTSC domain-containing protein [Polyangiales bacterium]